MKQELAEFLKKASDHCGNEDCKIIPDYSGRGMMGRETAALVVESVPELMLNVIQFIKEKAESQTPSTVDEIRNYFETIPDVSDVGKLRFDNLGHDMLIY